jgi:hypothetical protein
MTWIYLYIHKCKHTYALNRAGIQYKIYNIHALYTHTHHKHSYIHYTYTQAFNTRCIIFMRFTDTHTHHKHTYIHHTHTQAFSTGDTAKLHITSTHIYIHHTHTQAFNTGDISKFEQVSKAHEGAINAQAALVTNQQRLREKVFYLYIHKRSM